MLNLMPDIKQQEYELLNEIAQDSMVTQAKLSKRLGMAVGSVNWYIKRLIKRGWVKVSLLSRTRLQYDLTPEGMSVLTQRALWYMQSSLLVYRELREKALATVAELQQKGISRVYLQGDDEAIDILRLTCIEAGVVICELPCDTILKMDGQDYQISFQK